MCTAITHNILFNCDGSDSHIVHQILMIAYKKVFFIYFMAQRLQLHFVRDSLSPGQLLIFDWILVMLHKQQTVLDER